MDKYRRPTSEELALITEKLTACCRHEKLAYFLEALLVPGFMLFLVGIVKLSPICCVLGLTLIYATAWAMTNNVNVGAGRVSLDDIRVVDGRAERQNASDDSMNPHDLNSFVEFVSSDGDVFSQLFPADGKITDNTPMLLVCAPISKRSCNENRIFVIPSPALSRNE